MEYTGRHTFPLLKISTIVKCVNEMHIPVTDEDVTKPTPQRISAIYNAVTDVLVGCSHAQFDQPSFAVIQILEQPDLHQESLSLMAYFRLLRRFMHEIGVEDFSMRDLLKPEPRRVRRCLSAVINFAKFREEKMLLFETCTRRAEEALATREQLQLQNRTLNEQITAINTHREVQAPEAHRLSELNSHLRTELRDAKRSQTLLKEESDRLKSTKDDLQQALSLCEKNITMLKLEVQRVRGRIVRNPEKLKRSLADMASTLQGERASIAATAKRSRDVQTRIEVLDQVEHDLGSCLKLLHSCAEARSLLDQARAKVSSGTDAIDVSVQATREMEVQLQQLKRRVASAAERIHKLVNHQHIRTQRSDSRLETLRAEYDAAVAERRDAIWQCEEDAQSVAALEEKIARIREQDTAEAGLVEELMHKLSSQTAVYASALERSMAAAALI